MFYNHDDVKTHLRTQRLADSFVSLVDDYGRGYRKFLIDSNHFLARAILEPVYLSSENTEISNICLYPPGIQVVMSELEQLASEQRTEVQQDFDLQHSYLATDLQRANADLQDRLTSLSDMQNAKACLARALVLRAYYNEHLKSVEISHQIALLKQQHALISQHVKEILDQIELQYQPRLKFAYDAISKDIAGYCQKTGITLDLSTNNTLVAVTRASRAASQAADRDSATQYGRAQQTPKGDISTQLDKQLTAYLSRRTAITGAFYKLNEYVEWADRSSQVLLSDLQTRIARLKVDERSCQAKIEQFEHQVDAATSLIAATYANQTSNGTRPLILGLPRNNRAGGGQDNSSVMTRLTTGGQEVGNITHAALLVSQANLQTFNLTSGQVVGLLPIDSDVGYLESFDPLRSMLPAVTAFEQQNARRAVTALSDEMLMTSLESQYAEQQKMTAENNQDCEATIKAYFRLVIYLHDKSKPLNFEVVNNGNVLIRALDALFCAFQYFRVKNVEVDESMAGKSTVSASTAKSERDEITRRENFALYVSEILLEDETGKRQPWTARFEATFNTGWWSNRYCDVMKRLDLLYTQLSADKKAVFKNYVSVVINLYKNCYSGVSESFIHKLDETCTMASARLRAIAAAADAAAASAANQPQTQRTDAANELDGDDTETLNGDESGSHADGFGGPEVFTSTPRPGATARVTMMPAAAAADASDTRDVRKWAHGVAQAHPSSSLLTQPLPQLPQQSQQQSQQGLLPPQHLQPPQQWSQQPPQQQALLQQQQEQEQQALLLRQQLERQALSQRQQQQPLQPFVTVAADTSFERASISSSQRRGWVGHPAAVNQSGFTADGMSMHSFAGAGVPPSTPTGPAYTTFSSAFNGASAFPGGLPSNMVGGPPPSPSLGPSVMSGAERVQLQPMPAGRPASVTPSAASMQMGGAGLPSTTNVSAFPTPARPMPSTGGFTSLAVTTGFPSQVPGGGPAGGSYAFMSPYMQAQSAPQTPSVASSGGSRQAFVFPQQHFSAVGPAGMMPPGMAAAGMGQRPPLVAAGMMPTGVAPGAFGAMRPPVMHPLPPGAGAMIQPAYALNPQQQQQQQQQQQLALLQQQQQGQGGGFPPTANGNKPT